MKGPALASTCTRPGNVETVTGQGSIHGDVFYRSEFGSVAAGNLYDETFYRTEFDHQCFEVVFLIRSTDIGNYPPGTLIEFDRDMLLIKLGTVLDSFVVK